MLSNIIIGLVALVLGGFIGYLARKFLGAKSIQGAEQKADNIINSARQEEKSILLEAKDKAIKIIDEAKAEEKQRREDLKVTQDRLEKRESTFDQKILELENKQVKITEKTKELEEAKQLQLSMLPK